MPFRILALLLSSLAVAQAGLLKPDPDFSNYDVPVYEQIVNRIKAKISSRLGEGNNPRERYFIIPFAYEDRGNHPERSHSFISVIRVFPDNKEVKLTPGLETRKYKDRKFEAFTISWLPADFTTSSHLCVFDGFGARLFPEKNKCPISPGGNFNLEDTIKLAVHEKNAIAMWGPYEIKKPGFDLAVRRKNLLDGGTIKYRADDRLYRKDKIAISCFHAMAGLDQLFPNGGIFGTGFKVWGVNGTARVLIEYTEKANYKHILLEPVDSRKDRYGFVYAPTENPHFLYNPFRNASAYKR